MVCKAKEITMPNIPRLPKVFALSFNAAQLIDFSKESLAVGWRQPKSKLILSFVFRQQVSIG